MRTLKLAFSLAVVFLAAGSALPVSADATTLILLTGTIPPSHTIAGVPAQGQWWNLSCEYAATSAATAFYGKPITQQTFVDDIGFNPNPNIGFRGRLTGPWGGITDYGVYPRPILTVLQQRGFPHSYAFHADANMLKQTISQDHPVVAWIVGTFGTASRDEETLNGEPFFLVPYEHAVTVYGYTDIGVEIMDPAYGADREVSWQSFMSASLQMDGMALAVVP